MTLGALERQSVVLSRTENSHVQRAITFSFAAYTLIGGALAMPGLDLSRVRAVTVSAAIVSIAVVVLLWRGRESDVGIRPSGSWARGALAVLPALALCIFATVLLEPHRLRIVGESMEPSFHSGDEALAVNIDPRSASTGDVVLSRDERGRTRIKRILLRGPGCVSVRSFRRARVVSCSDRHPGEATFVLRSSDIFLVGDNLDASVDSRILGPVSIESVWGTVLFAWTPSAQGATSTRND